MANVASDAIVDEVLRFLLKDDTEIHRTAPPPVILAYNTGLPISAA